MGKISIKSLDQSFGLCFYFIFCYVFVRTDFFKAVSATGAVISCILMLTILALGKIKGWK